MPIELLIGADYDGNLFTGNICHLSSGLIAVDTYLGWSVMGRPKAASNNYSSISLFVQSHGISDLRRLETIGKMDPYETDSSKNLENQYLSTPYHDTAVKLKNSFYVDNCVTSVNSEKELRRFTEDSTNLMAPAKFDLRGWEFTGEAISLKDPKLTPVLGLLWDKSEDVLFCNNSVVEIPPNIITRQHRLVELLVREAHLENSHAGVQILLSKLREKFWVINGRRTIRRGINKCLRCKRYIYRNIETPTASLPQDRVEESAAFEVVVVYHYL
ncbi:pro-Pol polyprotein [Trichonephila clavata]|uniref:Pro-Pol polyprotein n=1 Tax=Trichonephila clavata TaxID=2740835 RepID=A0A8X6I4W7_TRICU|nr:pro-Pol polyprotein [Trichonephila clavata]